MELSQCKYQQKKEYVFYMGSNWVIVVHATDWRYVKANIEIERRIWMKRNTLDRNGSFQRDQYLPKDSKAKEKISALLDLKCMKQ